MAGAIPSDLSCCFAFESLQKLQPLSCYRGERQKKKESQKIDDLSVLATCRSGA